MRPAVLALVALGTLAGCSGESYENATMGRWAGPGIVLNANRAAVDIELYCGASIRIPRPLFTGKAGAFTLSDTIRGLNENRDTLPDGPYSKAPVTVSGRIFGDSMVVTIAASSELVSFMQQYSARTDYVPDVQSAVCRA